jgi:hypothetical protein
LATTHAAYAPPARGSIGVAFPGTEVRVASFDDVTADAPEGEDGELVIVDQPQRIPRPVRRLARGQLIQHRAEDVQAGPLANRHSFLSP